MIKKRWKYTQYGYCLCTVEIADAPRMPDRLDWRFKASKPAQAKAKKKEKWVQLTFDFL